MPSSSNTCSPHPSGLFSDFASAERVQVRHGRSKGHRGSKFQDVTSGNSDLHQIATELVLFRGHTAFHGCNLPSASFLSSRNRSNAAFDDGSQACDNETKVLLDLLNDQ